MSKELEFKVKVVQDGKTVEQVAKSFNELEDAVSGVKKQLNETPINTKQFKDLQKDLEQNEKALEKASLKSKSLGENLANIQGPIGSVVQGFQGLGQAAKAFIANPIGAVIAALGLAFTAIFKAIQSTERGMKALNAIMGAFSGLIQPVISLVQRLSVMLIEGLVAGIEKAVTWIGRFLPSLAESIKLNTDLANSLSEVEKAEAELEVKRAEQNARLSEAKEILEDTNRSLEDRRNALNQIKTAEEELAAEEVANAKERLRIANEKLKQNTDDKNFIKEVQAARIILANKEKEQSEIRNEFIQRERSLREEAAASEKQIDDERKKREEDRIAKIRERIQLEREYIETVKTLNSDTDNLIKTLDREIQLLKTKDETQKQILQNQWAEQDAQEAGFNALLNGLNQISNNASKIAGITEENLEKSGQLIKEFLLSSNKELLKVIDNEDPAIYEAFVSSMIKRRSAIENELKKLGFSDSLIDTLTADLDNLVKKYLKIAELSGEKFAIQTTELETEVYQKRLDDLEAFLNEKIDLEEQGAQEKWDRDNYWWTRHRDFILKNNETILGSAATLSVSLGALQDLNMARQAKELKAAGDDAAARDAINEKYFEKNKKLQIAETIVNTIASATAAFRSLAGIPVVGPALGAAAAAAALFSGYAQVRQIKATEYDRGTTSTSTDSGSDGIPTGSKFAQGQVNIQGAGTTTSDSIPAMISRGESVINANATAMFGPLLEMMNNMGRTDQSGTSQSIPTEQPVLKAYVVAEEMSSQQEANARIERLARL